MSNPGTKNDGIEKVAQNIGRVEGLLDRLSSQFPAPSRGSRNESETEDDIPFGVARKPFPAPQDRPKPQPNPQPRKQPQPTQETVRQEAKRPEPSFEQAIESFVVPPAKSVGRDSTRKFLLNTLQIGVNFLALGWVLSPKGLGGYVAFKPAIGLLGLAFWTPGVLLGLFAFGLYARHAGRTRLFETAWQITLAFIVAKLIAVVFFGGAW